MKTMCHLGPAAALCLSLTAASAAPRSTGTVTPAAERELSSLCSNRAPYTDASAWKPDPALTSMRGATSGTPLIEQFRNGRRIARYTSFADKPGCTYVADGTDHIDPQRAASTGCGPFTRVHAWRLWNPGDRFLVQPAVYRGHENNPFIGPAFDGPAAYFAKQTVAPDGLQIIGVVKDGVRPVILLDGGASENTLSQGAVYLDTSRGMLIENLEVDAGAGASVGRAGIYDVGASDLILRNVRVSGFARPGVNGLFGAGTYGGTLLLDHVELDHNGGTNGPAHNAYINASTVDPAFTVKMIHSWSHDAFYGHLFKSRAQVNDFEDNLFEGGKPRSGFSQAEAYLLDIPNGGRLTARDNVFIKSASGLNSNGASITFAVEGTDDNRPLSLDIVDNVFVSLASTYDGTHAPFPFMFFFPPKVPGAPGWPTMQTTVKDNVFAGYCPTHDATRDYRGDGAVTMSFAEKLQGPFLPAGQNHQ